MNSHTSRPRWNTAATVAATIALLAPLFAATGAAQGLAQADSNEPAPDAANLKLDPLNLEQAGFGTDTVTLLTGAAFTVDRPLDGPVTVTPTKETRERPKDGGPMVPMVQVVERPGEPARMTAVPNAATDLVDAGLVDANLFDLTHLLDNGHTGTDLPVTVHYDGQVTAAQAAADADGLPSAQYVDGTATAGQATVAVSMEDPMAFWDSVTEPKTWEPDDPQGGMYLPDDPEAPRALADGIAALTLDGAPADSAPDKMTPQEVTHTLTVRIHAREDRSRWRSPTGGLSLASVGLTRVTGSLADLGTRPRLRYCEDYPPCDTIVLVYEVPAGVYWHWMYVARDRREGKTARNHHTEPEVNVNGDATLDIHLDDGTWVEPDTPRLAEVEGMTHTEMRTLPDGSRVSNIGWSCGFKCYDGQYFIPTQTTVQTGSFNSVWTHNMRQPQIAMQIVGGRNNGTALNAFYRDEPDGLYPGPDERHLDVRDEVYEVVDVGMGTDAEFDKIDAAGKLVLIAPDPDADLHNTATNFTHDVMDRAEEHGAVAVLGDSSCPWKTYQPHCPVPMRVDWWPEAEEPPELPLITLSPSHATKLRELLDTRRPINRQRPVKLSVDSPVDQSEYFYTKAFHFADGGMTATLDQDMSSRQVVTRESRLHDVTEHDEALSFVSAYVAGMNIVAGTTVNWSVSADRVIEENFSMNPDIPRSHTMLSRSRNGGFDDYWNVIAGEVLYDESQSRTEVFNADPRSIGPQAATAFRPDNRRLHLCSFCRVDDVLWPFTSRNAAGERHHTPNGPGDIGILPNAVLKDEQGNEIPLSFRGGFLPVYELPSARQEYTLETGFTGGSTFNWTFTSETADQDRRPAGTTCLAVSYLGGSSCGEAVPMIYVRYAAPVDLDNRAPSTGTQSIDVTPYHHHQDGPTIDQVDTDVSFDSGDTWHDTELTQGEEGMWSATFDVPVYADTDGFVTLRTRASDVDGNTTDQTLVRAYGLRD